MSTINNEPERDILSIWLMVILEAVLKMTVSRDQTVVEFYYINSQKYSKKLINMNDE